ncbi:MAG: hypothetical protein GEV11_11140 [Streptosporangiales bacterium]|nr:hypothetical protein [Streptosporangiales bacterium]
MRIAGGIRNVLVVGGGPGGLYSAALLREAFPEVGVRVVERDPEGATYGWGVVFSEQTLGALEQADRVTYDRIREGFARWDAIDVHVGGGVARVLREDLRGLPRRPPAAVQPVAVDELRHRQEPHVVQGQRGAGRRRRAHRPLQHRRGGEHRCLTTSRAPGTRRPCRASTPTCGRWPITRCPPSAGRSGSPSVRSRRC